MKRIQQKSKNIFFLFTLASAIFLSSCEDKRGKVKVQNKMMNVTISRIRWGDYRIFNVLIPGETSDPITVMDKKRRFPKTNYLEFYMKGNNNTVYVRTKEAFSLDDGQTLLIEITDSMKLVNILDIR